MKKVFLLFLLFVSFNSFSQTKVSKSALISLLTEAINKYSENYEYAYEKLGSIKANMSADEDGISYYVEGKNIAGHDYQYAGTIKWDQVCAASRTWYPGESRSTANRIKIKLKSPFKATLFDAEQTDLEISDIYMKIKDLGGSNSETMCIALAEACNQLGKYNYCNTDR